MRGSSVELQFSHSGKSVQSKLDRTPDPSKKNKNPFWMRSIRFEILKDLYYFIYENNGLYRPYELESHAIENGIFVKNDGSFLSKTSRYYYRKILEHLNLITLIDKRYYYNTEKSPIPSLKSNKKAALSYEEKTFFINAIFDNEDCKNYFLNYFSVKPINDQYVLQKMGLWIAIERNKGFLNKVKNIGGMEKTKRYSIMVLKNQFDQSVSYNNQTQINSIFYGIRKWMLDLSYMDEFSDEHGIRYIYPINDCSTGNELKTFFLNYIDVELKRTKSNLLSIPEFTKNAALNTRHSVDYIKKFLLQLFLNEKASYVPIPASLALIEHSSPIHSLSGQNKNLYLRSDKIGYISHIRIIPKTQSRINNE